MIFGYDNRRLPEFVGKTVLDTIGLCISSPDAALRREMQLPDDVAALGLISSRTGAAGQIVAVDDAIKNSNTRLISIELPRDTKGWGGHGNYIVIGGSDNEDVRRAVEFALEEIQTNAAGVIITSAGHIEIAYSPRAGEAIHQAFDVPMGEAFGFLAASPAAIGTVMADAALKSAPITVTRMMTPNRGTAHSNEVILAFCGETSAVRTAVSRAEEVGKTLLASLGDDNFIYGPKL